MFLQVFRSAIPKMAAHRISRFLFFILFPAASILLSSSYARAIDYYIDGVHGNDTNDGLTLPTAFKTLGRLFRIGNVNPPQPYLVHQRHFTAGNPCTVYIAAGTYNTQATIMVSADYLTITKVAEQASPRIVAPINDFNNAAVALRIYSYSGGNWNHITLDGLDISGGYSFALKIDEFTSHTTVRNCRIHDSGADAVKIVGAEASSGGNATNSHTTIEYCEIYRSGLRQPGNAEGIDAMSISDAIVHDNYFHDIPTVGAYFKGHSARITFYNNFLVNIGTYTNSTSEAYDTYGAVYFGECTDQQYIPSAPNDYENEDSVAYNNVIANSGGAAFRAMGAKNARFYNNTVYNKERTYSSWYDYLAVGDLDVVAGCSSSSPRELNQGIYFNNNLILDSNKLGYSRVLYQNPFISIQGGAWASNLTTKDALFSDYNYYYRASGDPLWSDRTTSGLYTNLSNWISGSTQDKHSTYLTSSQNVLAILSNPMLRLNNLSSFQKGSSIPYNVGADISIIELNKLMNSPKGLKIP
jgi:hypothetical protein